jgi:hypothetical protein
MFAKLRSHRPSHAVVVAYLALFVALGGSSYAALSISGKNVKDSSLTGRDIRNRSLTGKDVKRSSLTTREIRNRTLLASDFAPGQLPAGATGPKGATGAKGDPATRLFASVTSAGHLVFGSGATGASRIEGGHFRVTFDRDLTRCALQATVAMGQPLVPPGDMSGTTFTQGDSANAETGDNGTVDVFTAHAGAPPEDDAFMLTVFC